MRLSRAPEGGRHRRSRPRLLTTSTRRPRRRRKASAATSQRRARPACRSRSTRAMPTPTPRPSSRTSTPRGRSRRSCTASRAGADLAQRALKLGLYVSFTGVVTFKKSEALRDIAAVRAARPPPRRDRRAVPRARALSRQEQRAGLRGRYRAQRSHRRKGVSPDELAAATTENFFRLFGKVPRPRTADSRRRMSLRATILGCGSSGGVPRARRDVGRLRSATTRKNRRRRCALLVERLGPGAATRPCSSTPRPTCASSSLACAPKRSTAYSTRTIMPTTRTASTICACSPTP